MILSLFLSWHIYKADGTAEYERLWRTEEYDIYMAEEYSLASYKRTMKVEGEGHKEEETSHHSYDELESENPNTVKVWSFVFIAMILEVLITIIGLVTVVLVGLERLSMNVRPLVGLLAAFIFLTPLLFAVFYPYAHELDTAEGEEPSEELVTNVVSSEGNFFWGTVRVSGEYTSGEWEGLSMQAEGDTYPKLGWFLPFVAVAFLIGAFFSLREQRIELPSEDLAVGLPPPPPPDWNG